jgi:putative oxidoreductase
MTLLVPLGRTLFAAIFIMSAYTHVQPAVIGYAKSVGLPAAGFLVPASGVLAGLGGLSVALGYYARIGALGIVIFLIPVTLAMHNFWQMTDTMSARSHMSMFMKNLSMLGGALLIIYFGSGPYSLAS